MNSNKIILDLCGGTSSWSKPYKEAGYDVRIIEARNGADVRFYEINEMEDIYGILAAPPCTCFAWSGRRWRRSYNEMVEALSVVDACLRIILFSNPVFWALENPTGTLRNYLGRPALIFQPWHHGDPYTKKTLLWGKFNAPRRNPCDAQKKSKMHKKTRNPVARAITPPGFAKAFFEANK